VSSLLASILRCLLLIRKATINWNMSVESLRATQKWTDRLIAPPRGIAIASTLVADVPAEWLTPARSASPSVILYVHGGGWTLGLHNLERRMLARMCQGAGVRALAVHYRLAPEQPFPAALEDCLAVYRWLSRSGISPLDIAVVGTSAGGNLVLATLMSLRDAGDPLPGAAVCISPMTDLAGTGESFHNDQDPALRAEFALSMARYYAGTRDRRLPLCSPYCADLRGLPPLLIHVGGDEILLSDAMRLRDAARSAGVDVTLVVWPRMWHGWHMFAPYLPEARQAVNDIGAFVRKHLTCAR
jgi:acetyl esterase/lipase